ncbi:MAG: class II fructose-bisphosphate aldolase [Eubacterium sp.]
MRDLLADAENGNYAVGSFSVANMEMVLGVLKQQKNLKRLLFCKLRNKIKSKVRLRLSVRLWLPPQRCTHSVAVHFDHGKTIEKNHSGA